MEACEDLIAAIPSVNPSGRQDTSADEEPPVKLVLVTVFNDLKTTSLSPIDSKFTGSLQSEGRVILLVDKEKVVSEIPRGGFFC